MVCSQRMAERKATHIDEFDIWHLFGQSRQQFISQLTVTQNDLFRSSTLDDVFEVSREVVCAKEGRYEVYVVSELEDLGEEFDPVWNAGEGEDDRDAVACFRVELDHV